jgi:hypothetical protein
MQPKLYLLGLFVSCFVTAHTQQDCIIYFNYKGSITGNTSKIIRIGLPTTIFLKGYVNNKSARAFAIYSLRSPVFNVTGSSHLSADFCLEPEEIIQRVFKSDHKNYPVKIFLLKQNKPRTYISRELHVPIDSIRFSINRDERKIVIHLGKIKL